MFLHGRELVQIARYLTNQVATPPRLTDGSRCTSSW